ncbi:MAG: Cell division coordinator CpoB [Chlamydiales bacterium]|nr:Cell division coordinator CpoB [Chlamydiales bacterium]MCH9619304.1 Cell division coordinator CpoB [Chlamydiales bacterium]MCH9622566.1 Cell division coordinator CpoB [Chlamydiales bacterium]
MFKKTIILTLLPLVVSCGLFERQPKEEKFSRAQEIERGMDLEKRGDYRKAVILWQKLQKVEPENGYVLYHLGWNYSRLKEYAKAEKYLKLSLEYDPDNIDAALALGYVYLWTDHFDKAKELFNEVLAAAPDYRSASQGLEEIEKRFAAAELEKVEKGKKEAVRTGLERADHFEREGDLSQALLEWKKLSVGDPENGYYYYQAGRIYVKMEEDEKAKEAFTRSLVLDPKNGDAKVALGYLYYREGNETEAKELFTEVLQEHPGYGDAQEGLDLIDKKQTVAKEEENQKQEKLQVDRATQLEEDERYEEAISLWVKQIEKKPENAYALYRLGRLYSKTKEYIKAEKYLKKSVKLQPDDSDAWLALGYVYLWTDRPEKAKEAFETVLSQVPDYKSAKEGLIYAEKRLSEPEKKKSWW